MHDVVVFNIHSYPHIMETTVNIMLFYLRGKMDCFLFSFYLLLMLFHSTSKLCHTFLPFISISHRFNKMAPPTTIYSSTWFYCISLWIEDFIFYTKPYLITLFSCYSRKPFAEPVSEASLFLCCPLESIGVHWVTSDSEPCHHQCLPIPAII